MGGVEEFQVTLKSRRLVFLFVYNLLIAGISE